jgi:hypothetical protein
MSEWVKCLRCGNEFTQENEGDEVEAFEECDLLCLVCQEEQAKTKAELELIDEPGVLVRYDNQMEELVKYGSSKLILLIGPDSRSSPFPTEEFRRFNEIYGKPIRYNNQEIQYKNGTRMIYNTYKSVVGIRGVHPDMIVIVNVYLFDVKEWWKFLDREIKPMMTWNKDIVVKYWRW